MNFWEPAERILNSWVDQVLLLPLLFLCPGQNGSAAVNSTPLYLGNFQILFSSFLCCHILKWFIALKFFAPETAQKRLLRRLVTSQNLEFQIYQEDSCCYFSQWVAWICHCFLPLKLDTISNEKWEECQLPFLTFLVKLKEYLRPNPCSPGRQM